MEPFKKRISMNGKELGDFVRDQDGHSTVIPTDKHVLSSVEANVLRLYGAVLSDAVCPHGHMPPVERLILAVASLGVPLSVLSQVGHFGDARIATLLNVPVSMVATRRLFVLRNAKRFGLRAKDFGGGDA